MPLPRTPYSYAASIKSSVSDEFINTYLQRPIAGIVTHALYYTPITPNQVTVLSTLCGMAGGMLLAVSSGLFFAAGILLYLKDIFDSADGQLARAKQMYSRRGRFLDSIGDFIVNVFLFGGVICAVHRAGIPLIASIIVGVCGFLGVSLRVSYQVFYQTAYLHTEEQYLNNRLTEEIKENDLMQDRNTYRLQKIFLVLYGWQDRLMVQLDRWCFNKRTRDDESFHRWYGDRIALWLNGCFGMGTEFVALSLCLMFGSLTTYLYLSILLFNVLWISAFLYRRIFLDVTKN
jgi:hypothetical protein